MIEAYLCDGVRTPIGRYGGSLSSVRADDLAAASLRTLRERNTGADWDALDDILLGCANQAGEDNRNIARMSALLAGYGECAPGATVNRLCGSGLEAVIGAARAIMSGDADFIIAGGVESMSRAPFVLPKAETAFSRSAEIFDTTIGWRFVNPAMQAQFGVDSMPQTAENVASQYHISRKDQDAFALRSQQAAARAQECGRLSAEITPVAIPQRKGADKIVDQDEHLRETSLEELARLKPIVREGGTVTAGNASGVNDGAAAIIVASEKAVLQHKLEPRARFLAGAVAGVAPKLMGIGPVPASLKALSKAGLKISDMSVIELNEAFAAQALACLRELGIADDAEHINPNGGAIALGHPLGMSGARLAITLTEELRLRQAQYGLAAMCIGVGQGIAAIFERP